MDQTKVLLNDMDGLENLLLEEQYSTDEIQATESYITDLFDKAAVMVFHDTLARPLPESVEIKLFRDDNPMLDVWRQWFEIAKLDVGASRPDHFVFHIREYMFRSIIDEEDNGFFIVTAIEEMMRAADLANWKAGETLLANIGTNCTNLEVAFGRDKRNPFRVLFKMVQLMLQYRAEGIAILGGRWLSGRVFDLNPNYLSWFRNEVISICQKAQSWLLGEGYGEDFFDMEMCVDDNEAVGLLLRILLMQGDLSENDWTKLTDGFKTGFYDFTQDEQKTILGHALSLDIKDYWQGLLSPTDDGDSIAPREPIMDFVKTWEGMYGSKITEAMCVNL